MSNYQMKVVFSLGEELGAKHDEALRVALLGELKPQGTFEYNGQEFKHEGSLLVSARFGRYNWRAYDGLFTRYVEITDEGSDNFPVAGFYRSEDSLTQASVTYQLRASYPLDEECIKRLLEVEDEDAIHNKTLNLPILQQRFWHLTLTSWCLRTANDFYEELRTSERTPTWPLHDAVPDPQKITIITQHQKSRGPKKV